MPYFWKQLCRRKALVAVTALSAVITCTLICGFHLGETSMSAQIGEVMDNLSVSCAVTNLTGTQEDGLDLPDWAIRLFLPVTADTRHIPETSFLDYLKEVRIKTSAKGEKDGQRITVYGVTTIAADRSIDPADERITWLDGYRDAVFEGEEPICLVSEDLYGTLSAEETDTQEITVHIKGRRNANCITERTLRIAGVVSGQQQAVYCPFAVVADAVTEVSGSLTADSISAVIKDNRRIDEFREKCAGVYFAEVDPRGIPQPWQASPLYESYPFALAVYDETLRETINTLERGYNVFRTCRIAVIVLTAGLGLVTGILSVRRRQRELALGNVMGCSRTGIFSEVFAGYGVVSVTGFAAAVTVFWIVFCAPPWSSIAAALGAGGVGTALGALPILINDDILMMTGKE